MTTTWTRLTAWVPALAAAATMAMTSAPAKAGDYNGDFMARAIIAGVLPDSDFGPMTLNGSAWQTAGAAEVDDAWVPGLTLTYFLSKNLAVELLCCAAKHDINGIGPLAGNHVGSTWIFPPALTLQYHFDRMGGFKPYVGAGLQYIHFFSEKSDVLGGTLDIDDALGFTLQAGVDVELGRGWYLNADVKKTWIESDWTVVNGSDTYAGSFDLDPLIVSAGLGYRFNLADLFGHRRMAEPLK